MTQPVHGDNISILVDDEFIASVDAGDIIGVVSATLDSAERLDCSCTIIVTGDEAVRQLNLQYRGVDAATDVLSFAAHEPDEQDSDAQRIILPPEIIDEIAGYLGDVIIAYPYAASQAARYGNSTAAELRLLAVHGALHLLGYDHDTPQGEAEMWSIQGEILEKFGDAKLSRRVYD